MVPDPSEDYRPREGIRAIAEQLNAHTQDKRIKHGERFSGHTINAMPGHRLYVGESGFRDVADVHESQTAGSTG